MTAQRHERAIVWSRSMTDRPRRQGAAERPGRMDDLVPADKRGFVTALVGMASFGSHAGLGTALRKRGQAQESVHRSRGERLAATLMFLTLYASVGLGVYLGWRYLESPVASDHRDFLGLRHRPARSSSGRSSGGLSAALGSEAELTDQHTAAASSAARPQA